MRRLSRLSLMLAMGFGIVMPSLDANSTIHYRTSTEQFDDCLDDEETCTAEEEAEHKRWYHHHRYRESYDDGDDPAEELDHDTSWPGKRDDSWDQLFR